MTPLVSICMPLYNCEKYLHDTIGSLLKQTYENFELIIVDDFSTDASIKIVKEYTEKDKRIKLFINRKKGGCSARNVAYENSTGKYIIFMDSDDALPPNFIHEHLKWHLKEDNPFAISFSTLILFNENDIIPSLTHTCGRYRAIDHDYCEENRSEMVVTMWETREANCPHCYMLPRAIIERTGLWNENLKKNQDGEFFERIILNSNFIKYISTTYSFYRFRKVGSVGRTHTKETMRSQLDSYETIIPLLFEQNNSCRTRNAVALRLGWWIFDGYPENRSMLKECFLIYEKYKIPFDIPYKRKIFNKIRAFLGWRLTIRLWKHPLIKSIYKAR